ncbi:MAG: valine--tRNA ligase [Holosporaceae bacterium]|jgi:valyl-tRNA synthetase|nr:valine--tRNA ligase [Holosporaceae bacterium]
MLEKNFNPKSFEKDFSFTLEASYRNENAEPFMVLLPPPNVTGSLHVGHALCYTLQDIMVRYKRLKGYDVLFQPGVDHAGIVTQLLVEKQLYEKGVEKGSLKREELLQEIWLWKESSGGTIIEQMKVLGISCDFSRLRFTLDDGSQKAVRRLFVKLYNDGLLYRGERMVNWDPLIRSAISDLEVVEKEVSAKIWYLKYKLENSDEFICVATTRPETLFGDVAIAVNSRDHRYADLIGKKVLIPLLNKPVPIIADDYADPEKGTGAVKITPAHDFNDFEVGKRHGLPVVNILNERAELKGEIPEQFQNLDRFKAREAVVAQLEAEGLLEKVEAITHKVPFGDRSGAMLEPRITHQWFIDAAKLAIPAVKAVAENKIAFIPKHWENLFFEWMKNIEPWCISRQIWWGHRIPAWYGPDEKIFVAENAEEALQKAIAFYGKTDVELIQDNDVLDTWYSSGMWPFITLDWPGNSAEFSKFYSHMIVVTGFDIIFFWIARMIMMGIYATGDVPFDKVYIHALVRDEKGQKMSKSRGNVIDPLELCDTYGADALRYTLASLASPGRDIKMGKQTVEIGRNFLTKLWNAVRFAQMNNCAHCPRDFDVNTVKHPMAQWMVQKIKDMVVDVENSMENYRFDEVARHIYQCVWNSFCDWYMEFIKPILQSESEITGSSDAVASTKKEIRDVTSWAIAQFIQILYPIAPFMAQKLCRELGILNLSWPNADTITLDSRDSVEKIDRLQSIISAVRSLRKFLGIAPAEKLEAKIETANNAFRQLCDESNEILLRMAGISAVQKLDSHSIPVVVEDAVVHLGFEGKIDIQSEKKRLTSEMEKLLKNRDDVVNRLNNKDFLQKAAPDIVQEHQKRLDNLNDKINKINHIIRNLV